ncbi:hypothetical protein [Actinomadura hibisca]|uniref:hypothetical protein n=1 Tax=Actinomadura hibisca TaxID=68565 RepID=UPI0008335438|nr:hypothetical protein [Actinomadura hibisca]
MRRLFQAVMRLEDRLIHRDDGELRGNGTRIPLVMMAAGFFAMGTTLLLTGLAWDWPIVFPAGGMACGALVVLVICGMAKIR